MALSLGEQLKLGKRDAFHGCSFVGLENEAAASAHVGVKRRELDALNCPLRYSFRRGKGRQNSSAPQEGNELGIPAGVIGQFHMVPLRASSEGR